MTTWLFPLSLAAGIGLGAAAFAFFGPAAGLAGIPLTATALAFLFRPNR